MAIDDVLRLGSQIFFFFGELFHSNMDVLHFNHVLSEQTVLISDFYVNRGKP